MPRKRCVKRHTVTQPVGKPYRFIPLTQGQNAIVDATDFEWLNQWNWNAQWSHGMQSFYAVRGALKDGRWTYEAMHRVILGCQPHEEGDHINHNTLDNRRNNLRKATRKQNGRNRRGHGKSGFKGVHRRSLNCWRAVIRVDGRLLRLGNFKTKEAAALAYNKAAKVFFGDFAYLNDLGGWQ